MAKNMFILHGFPQKALAGIFHLFVFAILNLTTSCVNNGTTPGGSDTTSPKNTDTGKGGARAGGAMLHGLQLPTLYITNKSAADQLAKLLNDGHGPRKKKWSLQFFLATDGQLRIQVFPIRANGDYVPEEAIIPEASKTQPVVSLPNNNVFLGDLQFGDRTTGQTDPPHGPNDRINALTFLEDHIPPKNNTGYEYIWFVPEVLPIEAPIGAGPAFTKQHVVYHVFASGDDPSVATSHLVTVTAYLDYANPSPPRQSY